MQSFAKKTNGNGTALDFELLRPSENAGKEDNDQSCVLRVVANGKALLITGDLGVKGEAGLIEKYGNALYSQVLVLGHHGSSTASSGSFLHTVSPQYAVASSGYANAYKHPTVAVQNPCPRARHYSVRTICQARWCLLWDRAIYFKAV